VADYDVIVIGAGPAGEVAAGRAGGHGLSVALVERELVGGECSFWACMPSKALLRPGEALDEIRRVSGAREAATGELDVGAALARRDEVVHDYDDAGMLPWLKDQGIALHRGEARLVGERRVALGDAVLEAGRAVVLATGSTAALPPIAGLADAAPWTNREATGAKAAPARLLALGGGVVGVELAQAWASLGSAVTLVEALPRVLSREEDFASEQVAEALRARGVTVRLGARAKSARRDGAGVTLTLEGGEALEAEEILVATGRRPRTVGLGLEAVGLVAGQPVEVDDRLRVPTVPWLYAVGDVNGRALLTHVGKYQARVAADVIAGRDARDRLGAGAVAPRVVFTDPAVAAVGHTLGSAREAGVAARAVDHPPGAVAGGSFHGRGAAGLARLVVDERRGVLVGATFTGPDVFELLHAATIAVAAEVPLERLWEAVPAFPTRSEVWLRLLESYGM
jgi:pyruvate/2-oxoglutarate dehydrogenase complex dihydrolipoamide dehydrogenase (E3) component